MIFGSSGPTRDRDVACEAALEAELDALIVRALEAGWTEDEVANALLSLAQDKIEAMRTEAFVGEDMPVGRLSH